MVSVAHLEGGGWIVRPATNIYTLVLHTDSLFVVPVWPPPSPPRVVTMLFPKKARVLTWKCLINILRATYTEPSYLPILLLLYYYTPDSSDSHLHVECPTQPYQSSLLVVYLYKVNLPHSYMNLYRKQIPLKLYCTRCISPRRNTRFNTSGLISLLPSPASCCHAHGKNIFHST